MFSAGRGRVDWKLEWIKKTESYYSFCNMGSFDTYSNIFAKLNGA